jgi:caa(3)-type oxidase subunit IV
MASALPHRVTPYAAQTEGAKLIRTLLGLLVLTAVSWGLAHVNLGALNTAAALAIAGCKASVVAYVFMELSHATTVQRAISFLTLAYIALLCFGIRGDVDLR